MPIRVSGRAAEDAFRRQLEERHRLEIRHFPDGQRFLASTALGEVKPDSITLVHNFAAEK